MIDNEKIYNYVEYIVGALMNGTHKVTYFDVNENVVYNQDDERESNDIFNLTIELKRLPEKKKENKVDISVGVKLDTIGSIKDTLEALAQDIAADRYKGLY